MAALLGESKYKTLVIDLDPQANATSGFGIDKPSIESTAYQLIVENTDPDNFVKKTDFNDVWIIPSNADVSGAEAELFNRDRREFFIKERIQTLKREFDFVLLDCPPSLGMITINALVASNYIIIPLQCEYYALEGLGQLVNTYQLIQMNLNPELEIGGVLLTMADFRTNLTQQVIEEVKAYFKGKVFESIIPRSVKMSEAPSFGKPAVFYDAQNRASKSYRDAAREFMNRFSSKTTAVVLPQDAEGPSESAGGAKETAAKQATAPVFNSSNQPQEK
jgi:chromosome partitioning protein